MQFSIAAGPLVKLLEFDIFYPEMSFALQLAQNKFVTEPFELLLAQRAIAKLFKKYTSRHFE